MVIFFDILVLDDDVCLKKAHRQRRLLLKDVVQPVHGRADISEQQILDFSRPDSPSRLERIFAKGIAQRWEGFVLKGCEEPYFSIFPSDTNGTFGRWIKLKKDYIPGLGDTLDLALVGAKYEPRDATALSRIPKLLWTHFFIGCLLNKDAVSQQRATPRFRVVDVIDHHCMSLRNMQILNQFGEFIACDPAYNPDFKFEYERANLPTMGVIFKAPLVVEMLGSGFEKPSGARYFALRFPRILKVHWDRTFEDATSFQELQQVAEKARSVTAEDDSSQEHWCKRLKLANGACQYIDRGSQSTLFESTSTSGLDDEDSVESTNTNAMLPTPLCTRDSSRVDQMDTAVTENQESPIPIHIDDTAGTLLSSSESGFHSHPLTENPNQSSYQKARARKDNARPDNLAASVHSSGKEGNGTIKRHDTKVTAAPRPLVANVDSHSTNKNGYTTSTSALSTTREQQLDLRSPILTLPQYSCSSSSSHKYHSKLTKATHSPDNLFQEMTSHHNSNPHTTPQNQSLGLVLLPQSFSLGQEILNIIKSLSQSLRTVPKFPPTGKVFFLDSKVLTLGNGPEDTRFCLRATWENISKVYFYACVSWSTTTAEQSLHRRSLAIVDEIPCTKPGDDIAPGSAPMLDQMEKVDISVCFEKNELNCLGKFVSIEPLMHVNGQTYIS